MAEPEEDGVHGGWPSRLQPSGEGTSRAVVQALNAVTHSLLPCMLLQVRTYVVKEKNKDILKALNRTKTESYPDLEGKFTPSTCCLLGAIETYLALLRIVDEQLKRKKQRQQFEAVERKAREERKQQKEMRSYACVCLSSVGCAAPSHV
jgi:hypothetical protein